MYMYNGCVFLIVLIFYCMYCEYLKVEITLMLFVIILIFLKKFFKYSISVLPYKSFVAHCKFIVSHKKVFNCMLY